MRGALRGALQAAAFAALMATSIPSWGETRPLVRVVLTARGDSPAWFDGFVKHLESELLLRGIDVAVVRGAAPTTRSASPGASPPDAVLVVEAPSTLHAVLRFSLTARDVGASADGASPGRVREVNLNGVPSDGYALALAVAADELMRSNWARAIPVETARPVEPTRTAEPVRTAEQSPPAATAPAARSAPEARPAPEATRDDDAAARDAVAETQSGSSESDTSRRGAGTFGTSSRFAIGAAAAFETFGGGQTQWGPELRGSLRIVPRLEVELRAGWRQIVRHETPNGAAFGSAIAAGGALRWLAVGNPRAALWLVGRSDLLRVAYQGEARDAAIAATPGSALGWFVSAGPSGRIALTQALRLEGEVTAGGSPFATTATDDWNDAISTKGAVFGASLGLSWSL
ncbi:MAG: hypothetical protein ABW133_12435 [Polyangiaceae bacterium]